MSKFGWSYPAGCSGPPDDIPAPSDLVEAVLGLLEDAFVPTEINDKIVELIEGWEAAKDNLIDADAADKHAEELGAPGGEVE